MLVHAALFDPVQRVDGEKIPEDGATWDSDVEETDSGARKSAMCQSVGVDLFRGREPKILCFQRDPSARLLLLQGFRRHHNPRSCSNASQNPRGRRPAQDTPRP